ncbi:hypothetical protein IE81DRAFT_68582 [Ceraceosorus guamensis]|uniref:Uncharacterized protein n=1 Tax=Ceraceosorus guamensis TaxID=1522189 RepID=A0A316W3R9_9BASI|nr:hypothetical protein IE81DRAFT_68582 [Ceraceosorus guamensis]PWN43768.1 hypothetical protein IE81DRAFT_68582 [Ceraceosorus guamensis]
MQRLTLSDPSESQNTLSQKDLCDGVLAQSASHALSFRLLDLPYDLQILILRQAFYARQSTGSASSPSCDGSGFVSLLCSCRDINGILIPLLYKHLEVSSMGQLACLVERCTNLVWNRTHTSLDRHGVRIQADQLESWPHYYRSGHSIDHESDSDSSDDSLYNQKATPRFRSDPPAYLRRISHPTIAKHTVKLRINIPGVPGGSLASGADPTSDEDDSPLLDPRGLDDEMGRRRAEQRASEARAKTERRIDRLRLAALLLLCAPQTEEVDFEFFSLHHSDLLRARFALSETQILAKAISRLQRLKRFRWAPPSDPSLVKGFSVAIVPLAVAALERGFKWAVHRPDYAGSHPLQEIDLNNVTFETRDFSDGKSDAFFQAFMPLYKPYPEVDEEGFVRHVPLHAYARLETIRVSSATGFESQRLILHMLNPPLREAWEFWRAAILNTASRRHRDGYPRTRLELSNVFEKSTIWSEHLDAAALRTRMAQLIEHEARYTRNRHQCSNLNDAEYEALKRKMDTLYADAIENVMSRINIRNRDGAIAGKAADDNQ